jgi:hypothetical protein
VEHGALVEGEGADPGRLFVRVIQVPVVVDRSGGLLLGGERHAEVDVEVDRGEPAGFSNLLASVMTPAIRRANRKDLASLKSILEARR